MNTILAATNNGIGSNTLVTILVILAIIAVFIFIVRR